MANFEQVLGPVREDVGGGDFYDSIELFEVLVFVGIEIAEGRKLAESSTFLELKGEPPNGGFEHLVLFGFVVSFDFKLELGLR